MKELRYFPHLENVAFRHGASVSGKTVLNLDGGAAIERIAIGGS
jgi:hypothetical protein